VDAGEDPIAAIERELMEETGLTIKTTGLIDVLSGQEHPFGAHNINIILSCLDHRRQVSPR